MKLGTVIGVALLVVHLKADCPQRCTCSHDFRTSKARCSILDPRLQLFSEDIDELEVDNYPNEKLPAKIFSDLGLDGLLTIRLHNGSLTFVNRDALFGLNYLNLLDLSYNKIKKLDPLTFETVYLERLNLDGNPLMMYDTNDFLYSDSLFGLSLSKTGIFTLEHVQALSTLKSLEFLDLSRNRFQNLSSYMFSSLVKLQEINLSYNMISHVNKYAFANIEALYFLNLSGNPLNILEGIEIPCLLSLDISNCNLEILSASSLEGLPELCTLNFSKSSISSIDKDVFKSVPSLRDLDLSYNKLRGPLSPVLFKFNKRLETLSFRGNTEIKYLPGFEGEFPNLYTYDISNCGLTDISDNTFKGMQSLVSLNASRNSLAQINPKTFVNLPDLQVLDLSNNFIHSLDSQLFSGNNKFSELHLSKNFFMHLPSPVLFQSTPLLRRLDVSDCHLTSMWNISESRLLRYRDIDSDFRSLVYRHDPFSNPTRFRYTNILRNLNSLNLSRNNLTTLHAYNFISMEFLRELDISGNPIECSPDFEQVLARLRKDHFNLNRRRLFNCDVRKNNVNRNNVTPWSFFDSEIHGTDMPVIESPLISNFMIFCWLLIIAVITGSVIYMRRRDSKGHAVSKPQLSFIHDDHCQVWQDKQPIDQKLQEVPFIPSPMYSTNNLGANLILGNALGQKNGPDIY